MSNITICSVARNDIKSNLLDLMIRSVVKFIQNPQFIICDSGGNDLRKYHEMPNFHIIDNTKSPYRGSAQHGDSLNKMRREVKTKYIAVIESDCVIISDLQHDSYEPLLAKKGERNGIVFYYAALMMFKTSMFKNIDFRPGDGSSVSRSYQPHEDVAWKIGTVIKPAQVDLMDCVDCKSGQGQILDNTFQSEEFWINGKAAVVHFGRGSNLAGKANRKGFDSNKVQLQRFKDEMEKY